MKAALATYAALLAVSLSTGHSLACSPVPAGYASSMRAQQPYPHEFVAIAVADSSKRPSDGRTRGWIATLKVLESATGNPAVGATLTMRKVTSVGADCSRQTADLTLYDYPEGTKLRIKAYGLGLADEIEYVY